MTKMRVRVCANTETRHTRHQAPSRVLLGQRETDPNRADFGPTRGVALTVQGLSERLLGDLLGAVVYAPLAPARPQHAGGGVHVVRVHQAALLDEPGHRVGVVLVVLRGDLDRVRFGQTGQGVLAIPAHCPRQDGVGLELQRLVEVSVLLLGWDDDVERDHPDPAPYRSVVTGHLGQVVGDQDRGVRGGELYVVLAHPPGPYGIATGEPLHGGLGELATVVRLGDHDAALTTQIHLPGRVRALAVHE